MAKKKEESKGKRKPSQAFLDASLKWRTHLNAFRKEHPELSLSEAMKKAKDTYKK